MRDEMMTFYPATIHDISVIIYVLVQYQNLKIIVTRLSRKGSKDY